MNWTHLLLTTAALAAALLAPGGQAAQPDIVLIVADDLRADVLSTYGGSVETPNLDRLARRGVVFERATCGYPICHVSRAEMLTGRYLVAEAVEGRAVALRDQWALWPAVMRQAGWRTIHCGKWHVQGTPWSRGYTGTEALYSGGGAKGLPLTCPRSATGRTVTGYTGWTFKTNDNQPLPELGVGLTPQTDTLITDGAVKALEQAGSQEPLFLCVNFTAPHDPLHWPGGREDSFQPGDVELPANFRPEHPFDHGNIAGRDEMIVPAPRTRDAVRGELAVYYALVEHIDALVGRIVETLERERQLARTVVIFTSDQGMAMGSHGLMGKQNQYEHTVNVPLILAGPGVPEGQRIATQCALRDLFPTLCDMTGLAVPESVEGKSLVPALQGHQVDAEQDAFGYFMDSQRMIRTPDGWKLTWYPRIDRLQLFHVEEDPDELQDLAGDDAHRHRVEQLKERLMAWLRERGDPAYSK